jgi:hypothetical protein
MIITADTLDCLSSSVLYINLLINDFRPNFSWIPRRGAKIKCQSKLKKPSNYQDVNCWFMFRRNIDGIKV